MPIPDRFTGLERCRAWLTWATWEQAGELKGMGWRRIARWILCR